MTIFEEMIRTVSEEDLQMFDEMIQKEKEKRKENLFLEEKEKVLTALRSFKEKFPDSSIEFSSTCLECSDFSCYDILDYIDDLDFTQ